VSEYRVVSVYPFLTIFQALLSPLSSVLSPSFLALLSLLELKNDHLALVAYDMHVCVETHVGRSAARGWKREGEREREKERERERVRG
jgi:hypothetical protein